MQNEFLESLRKELYFFDENEINDVLSNYEEIISERSSSGETIEDIIMSFDKPKEIAAQFALDQNININEFNKFQVNFRKDIKKAIKHLKENKNDEKDTFNAISFNNSEVVMRVLKYILIVFKMMLKIAFIIQSTIMISAYLILLVVFRLEQYSGLFFMGGLVAMCALLYLELYAYNSLFKKES